MNLGIIGGGSVATAHLKALQKIAAVEKILVYTRGIERAQELATQFNKICIAESIKPLTENVAGIIIATPNNTHLALLKEIISIKNIPVLCEKPLASSLKEAEEFSTLAPPLSIVGFNYRFNKAILFILAVCQQLKLGDILYIDLALNRNSALTKKTIGWRDDASQQSSSGAFGDLGSHMLDLIHYLTHSTIEKNSLNISTGIKVKTRQGITLTADDHSVMAGITTNKTIFKIQTSKTAEAADVGFHVNIIFHQGEIRYFSQFPHKITLSLMNEPGIKELHLDTTYKIKDPETETPSWSDSFYLQNEAWIKQLATKHWDERLANMEEGCKIQRLISTK
jgi:glucose-6-phosphate 3-dehydrogenase